MWFTVFLLSLSIIYILFKWNYSFWKKHGVPGPEPSILVGNLWETFSMKRHFGEIVAEWYEKYSKLPYFGYYRCLTPVLVVRDPEIVHQILVKDFNSFAENDFGINRKTDPLIALNPFVLTGDEWKQSRGTLSQLFTPTKIKLLFPLMQLTCEKLKKFIDQKGVQCDFDAKDLAAKFTTDNVANCAFSLDGESFTNSKSEFRKMGKKIFQPSTAAAIKFMFVTFIPSLLDYIPIPLITKEVDQWIRKLVRDNVESRKNTKMSHEDLLQMLLQTSEKQKLSETEVTGYSLSFFTEGYETSSTLLSFVMYEMAQNPDIQERLHDEINDVLIHHNKDLSYEAIQEMTYLEQIMYETLRLRPVAFTMHKICTKPFTLPPLPGQTTGFTIPEKMPITIDVYSMHHDPTYFSDPKCFDPERHSEEQKKNRPKSVFIPFGDGPRMCMGMRFALAQTKAALVTIIQNFQIKLSPNCKPFEIDPKALLYQGKEPLLLNFEPRK